MLLETSLGLSLSSILIILVFIATHYMSDLDEHMGHIDSHKNFVITKGYDAYTTSIARNNNQGLKHLYGIFLYVIFLILSTLSIIIFIMLDLIDLEMTLILSVLLSFGVMVLIFRALFDVRRGYSRMHRVGKAIEDEEPKENLQEIYLKGF